MIAFETGLFDAECLAQFLEFTGLVALAAEATSLWLVVAGSIVAVLFVIAAMVLGYGWAQKKFQDDVEL